LGLTGIYKKTRFQKKRVFNFTKLKD